MSDRSDTSLGGEPLPTASARPSRKIEIKPLGDDNRAAVIAFMSARLDRPHTAEFAAWRYERCPTMQAAIAMAGDECIATMFALRRSYVTPDGVRDCLEPFEWHAGEEWRAQAPGLRIVQQYMKGDMPLVAVAGTDVAAGLLVRLKWTRVATADRFVLPLTGRYLANRGRGRLVARAFDLIGRPLFTPRARRGSPLVLEPASSYAPGLRDIVVSQTRFALMRLPDALTGGWLQSAPAAVGHYLTFHARIGQDLVGWVTARVYSHGTQSTGELLEVFLGDEWRAWYPALVQQASATLAAFGVDLLTATTTCPDTQAALRALRFRHDDFRPAFAWWGKQPAPTGSVLVDGAISDHAFFPVQNSAGAAWLEADGRATR